MPGEAKVMVCAVKGAGATVTVKDTGDAAAYKPLPAWLAAIEQLPALTSVKVVPLTVHTLAVLEVSVTGRPDVAVATKAPGAVPKAWLPGEMKEMVWAPMATAKVLDTVVAAWKLALPA